MRTIGVSLLALALQAGGQPAARPLADDPFDGDPVSLSTGLYWRSDDDISIDGVTLTRTYRTRDDGVRPFGIGVSHSFNIYLVGDSKTFQWADLILADGGRIHYRRVTKGQTKVDATFEHTGSPTEFYGSLLQWNGGGWTIDLRDGGRYAFGACTPGGKDVCHLLAKLERDGAETRLGYDNETGDLQTITAGEGRWIALSYDASHRITAARASTGERVEYRYDQGSHLTGVTTSNGRTQEYTYGPHNEVLTIREPDRQIVNSYDAALRCVKQVITRAPRGGPPRGEPEVYEFSYRVNTQNKIVETKTVQPTGVVRIATFNTNGYLVTDTSDPNGPAFQQVIYARDENTNLSPRVTVRCAVRGQILEAFADVSQFEHPDNVRGQLIARTCH
jgi:YD repeat-containing protein